MVTRAIDFIRQLGAHAKMHTLSDDELLRLCRDPEERKSALTTIVNRYAQMVLVVCRRYCQTSQEVDDAFQATFLALLRKLETVRAGGLCGWLSGAARLAAQEERRAACRRWSRHAPSSSLTEYPAPVEQEADPAELAAILEEVGGLDEDLQRAVTVHHLSGLPYRETAERLGISTSTLYDQLRRSYEALAERLRRRGITLSIPVVTALTACGQAMASPELVAAAVRTGLAGTGSKSLGVLARALPKELASSLLGPIAAVVVAAAVIGGVGLGLASPGEPPLPPPGASDRPFGSSRARLVARDPGQPGVQVREGLQRLPQKPSDHLPGPTNGLAVEVQPTGAAIANPAPARIDQNRVVAELVLRKTASQLVVGGPDGRDRVVRKGEDLPPGQIAVKQIYTPRGWPLSAREVHLLGQLEKLNALSLSTPPEPGVRLLDLPLERLKQLKVYGWEIPPADGMKVLVTRGAKLRVLHLGGCPSLGDAHLAELPALTKLTELSIRDTGAGVSDEGLGKHVSRLGGLVSLDVSNTRVTASGLLSLKGLPLQRLSVMGCGLGHADLTELQQAFPGCAITAE
jgi:RNA polymerase sigma factor (sigma-70 family)